MLQQIGLGSKCHFHNASELFAEKSWNCCRITLSHLTCQEEELIALLRDEEDGEDKLFQTDISDGDLIRVMDRSDLITTSPPTETTTDMYPLKGPGWEVIVPSTSGGMLSSLTS